MAKLKQFTCVNHTVCGAPKSRRERRLWWTPYPNLHNSNPKVMIMSSDKSSVGVFAMRYDDPSLDGNPSFNGPEPVIDCSRKPDILVLKRTQTNKYGWTLGAMIRGTLGARADGLNDLETARAVAKVHVPHVEIEAQSPAYLRRIMEIRHDDWQPPASPTVRNVLQDADAPLRLDVREG